MVPLTMPETTVKARLGPTVYFVQTWRDMGRDHYLIVGNDRALVVCGPRYALPALHMCLRCSARHRRCATSELVERMGIL